MKVTSLLSKIKCTMVLQTRSGFPEFVMFSNSISLDVSKKAQGGKERANMIFPLSCMRGRCI